MNKLELLNEKEKLNHDYWELELKCQKQYQKYIKERSKYVGMKSKVGKIKNRMIEIINIYKEK